MSLKNLTKEKHRGRMNSSWLEQQRAQYKDYIFSEERHIDWDNKSMTGRNKDGKGDEGFIIGHIIVYSRHRRRSSHPPPDHHHHHHRRHYIGSQLGD